jgi:hypothetical protein
MRLGGVVLAMLGRKVGVLAAVLLMATAIGASCGGSRSGRKIDAGGALGSGGMLFLDGGGPMGGAGGTAAMDAAASGGSTGGAATPGTGGTNTGIDANVPGTGDGGVPAGGSDMRGSGGVGPGGSGGAASGGAAGAASGGAAGAASGGAVGTGVGGTSGTAGAAGSDAGINDAAAMAACRTMTTQAACEARADCHPVFVMGDTCGCATAGCCAQFASCAAGNKARCSGSVMCEVDPPRCEGPYVVAYQGTCYEGCVRKTDCSP